MSRCRRVTRRLDEILALCEVVRRYPGTTLEYITDGCLNGFSDDEIERMAQMTFTGRRPLNWNVLTVDSHDPDRVTNQLRASDRAAELGGRIVALTMPTIVGMNMSFGTFCALWLIPGWGEVYDLADPRADREAARIPRCARSSTTGPIRRRPA